MNGRARLARSTPVVILCVVVALALVAGFGAADPGDSSASSIQVIETSETTSVGDATEPETAAKSVHTVKSVYATGPENATEPEEFSPVADPDHAGDPLENETGTTEVVVRLTPLDEPDAEGDEAIEELRAHAETERAAFESFAEDRPGVRIEREFWLANALLVHVDAEAVDTDDLLAVSNVTTVHENVAIETRSAGAVAAETGGHTALGPGTTPPPGTEAVAQATAETGAYTPGLELIDAPAAWDRFETRGAGATVAVIDTGVDPTHQDLDLVGWAEFDENGTLVSDRLEDAADPDGHGTHVAGTIAGGNASGTHIGVAPDASLYGMDAFGDEGTATFASVLAAMQRATAADDVDIIQMSLGADGTFDGFIAPVRNARAAGTIVVAAAGNSGHETSSAPANVYDSLAVGAVRDDRTVATFSAGETVNKTAAFREPPEEWPDRYVVPDVTAPGVGVLSAEAGTTDGYVEQQGTSMAAPHVAGVAALAVSATDGRIDGDDLQAALIDTAVHPENATEPDDRHGHGVVDAPAAVDAALTAAPPPPPDDTSDEPDVDTTSNDLDDDTPGFGGALVLVALAIGSLVAVGRARRI